MTCSSCTHAVEEALAELPGVTSAVVSLVQQEARIEYSKGLITQVRRTCTCSDCEAYYLLSAVVYVMLP